MRSVFLHLRDTTEDQAAAFLRQAYPFQQGPPWICAIDGDPCLYIHFNRDIRREYELTGEMQAWRQLVVALGAEPQVNIMADVSGRHDGDEQVRTFVQTMLAQFHGVARDEYTAHCWTAGDLCSGRLVEGHGFFDYRGWYENKCA